MNDRYPIVILAGGLATRLRPQTEKIPKALIEINGEPFVAHQLRLIQQQGIQEVVICSGFLGEQIEAFVGTGAQFGLNVFYSSDWPRLLGTGGAIKKALDLIKKSAFFVIYGDSFLTCDFGQVQSAFEQQKKLSLMTVYENHNQWDKSNVEFVKGSLVRYDKRAQTSQMQHIDYGLGIFDKAAFDDYSAEEPFDLADLYQKLLAQNQVAAFEVKDRFYEIGSFEGQRELSNYLNQERV